MAAPAFVAPTLVHDRLLIESLEASQWRVLFDAYGYPPGLSAEKLTNETIAAALAGDAVSPDLLDAVQTIHDLGNDTARDTLFEAAAEQGLDLGQQRDATPLSAAVHVVARSRSSKDVARVVRLALVTVHEQGAPETLKEFAGAAPRELRVDRIDTADVAAALRPFFEALGMGSHVQVFADVTSDESVVVLVMHGYRRQSALVVDDAGRRVLEYRPAVCDALKYEPSTGRLRISARAERVVQKYREVAGEAFFRDRGWFAGDALWDLGPLAERGRACLAIDPGRHPNVAEVGLTEILWVTPRGNRMRLHGADVFAETEALSLRLREGQLVEARLRVRLHGPRPNRATVVIRPPNHAKVPSRFESVLLGMLSDAGLRRAAPSAEHRRLWSLAGGPRAVADWRAAYGAELDRMRHAGVIVGARLAAIEHPDFPGRPGALSVHRLHDEDVPVDVGVGSDGVPSRTLTASDVEGARLDEGRLAGLLAEHLGASARPEHTVIEGTYCLGPVTIGTERVHVFVILREPAVPAAHLVQLASAKGLVVVLLPPDCSTGSGLREVTLHRHAPPFDSNLTAAIADALGLSDKLDAVQLAPIGTRLVVDCSTRRAWFDGHLLTKVGDDQRFRWLELVAYAAFSREPLDTTTLSDEISAGPDAYKRAKRELLKAMADSFTSVGKPVPADLNANTFPAAGGKNGYGVGLTVWVRGEPVRRR